MAELWEYSTPHIAWNKEKRCFQATLPNGNLGESQNIGVLLGSWGAEGWELVNVAAERYVAGDIVNNANGPIAGLYEAWAYCAFFKRRR